MYEETLYRVIVSKWDNDEMYIIAAGDVNLVNLHNCYNQYGQRIDAEAAGDYSLKNCYCDSMKDDMIAEGKIKFGDAFGKIEYDSNSLEIENAGEIDLEDRKEEINIFIKKYEKEHAAYTKCEAIQYWDGHNNRSVIIGEEVGADYEYADREIENEILKEYFSIECPEYKQGIADVKGEKYSFRFSQYQNKNFCICEVSERSPFGDEE